MAGPAAAGGPEPCPSVLALVLSPLVGGGAHSSFSPAIPLCGRPGTQGQACSAEEVPDLLLVSEGLHGFPLGGVGGLGAFAHGSPSQEHRHHRCLLCSPGGAAGDHLPDGEQGLRAPGLGSIPAFTSWVTLSQSPNLPEHQFIHLQNGDSTVPVTASPQVLQGWGGCKFLFPVLQSELSHRQTRGSATPERVDSGCHKDCLGDLCTHLLAWGGVRWPLLAPGSSSLGYGAELGAVAAPAPSCRW